MSQLPISQQDLYDLITRDTPLKYIFPEAAGLLKMGGRTTISPWVFSDKHGVMVKTIEYMDDYVHFRCLRSVSGKEWFDVMDTKLVHPSWTIYKLRLFKEKVEKL
jgi:hypothetical protein